MDHVETSLLSKPELKFVRYARYVDDEFFIYNSDSELDFLLQGLNSFRPYLKFYIFKPQ